MSEKSNSSIFERVREKTKYFVDKIKDYEIISKMFLSTGGFIKGAIAIIAVIGIGFLALSIWIWIVLGVIGAALALPWWIVSWIFDPNLHLSFGQEIIAGILIIILLFFVIIFISWLFTGSPPILAFLSRIICLSGVAIGIYLINRDIVNSYCYNFIIENDIDPPEIFFQVLNYPISYDPIFIIAISFLLGLFSEFISGVHNLKGNQNNK